MINVKCRYCSLIIFVGLGSQLTELCAFGGGCEGVFYSLSVITLIVSTCFLMVSFLTPGIVPIDPKTSIPSPPSLHFYQADHNTVCSDSLLEILEKTLFVWAVLFQHTKGICVLSENIVYLPIMKQGTWWAMVSGWGGGIHNIISNTHTVFLIIIFQYKLGICVIRIYCLW